MRIFNVITKHENTTKKWTYLVEVFNNHFIDIVEKLSDKYPRQLTLDNNIKKKNCYTSNKRIFGKSSKC